MCTRRPGTNFLSRCTQEDDKKRQRPPVKSVMGLCNSRPVFRGCGGPMPTGNACVVVCVRALAPATPYIVKTFPGIIPKRNGYNFDLPQQCAWLKPVTEEVAGIGRLWLLLMCVCGAPFHGAHCRGLPCFFLKCSGGSSSLPSLLPSLSTCFGQQCAAPPRRALACGPVRAETVAGTACSRRAPFSSSCRARSGEPPPSLPVPGASRTQERAGPTFARTVQPDEPN